MTVRWLMALSQIRYWQFRFWAKRSARCALRGEAALIVARRHERRGADLWYRAMQIRRAGELQRICDARKGRGG